MMFRRKEKLTHRHYVYTCLFNSISLENKTCSCVLEDQREILRDQQRKKDLKTFPEGYRYLLHCSRELCIYAITTRDWKNSSDATSSRDFIACEYAQREIIEGSQRIDKMYISEEELAQVFDKHFVSLKTMSSLLNEVTTSLAELTEKLLHASLEDKLSIKALIDDKKALISKKHEGIIKMRLNYELPYNDWLFGLVREKLTPCGFAVFLKEKGRPKVVAAINEYVFCKSDLLLHHELHDTIDALQVNMSQLSLDGQNDGITEVGVGGAVAELKVENFGVIAENECFYNMFGEAAKLTLQVLCRDKPQLVKYVNMYGIVVGAHDHKYAQLLKLEINFFEGTCTFKRCNKRVPFINLLNETISILDKSSVVS